MLSSNDLQGRPLLRDGDLFVQGEGTEGGSTRWISRIENNT